MFVWLRLVVVSGLTFAVAYGVTSWMLYPDAATRSSGPVAADENTAGAGARKEARPEIESESESEIETGSESEPKPRTRVAATGDRLTRFEKLDAGGAPLPDDAGSWNCVRDTLFNLVWEVKQRNGAVRDLDFTYSWLSVDALTGTPDGGKCFYIECDTRSLVRAINKEGLCGRRDWRLPTNLELMTLYVESSEADPDIDRRYFPNAKADSYWSSSISGDGVTSAWSVNFGNGLPEVTDMKQPHHVRLVRSEP